VVGGRVQVAGQAGACGRKGPVQQARTVAKNGWEWQVVGRVAGRGVRQVAVNVWRQAVGPFLLLLF